MVTCTPMTQSQFTSAQTGRYDGNSICNSCNSYIVYLLTTNYKYFCINIPLHVAYVRNYFEKYILY